MNVKVDCVIMEIHTMYWVGLEYDISEGIIWLFFNIFGLSYCLSGPFNQVIKLLRSRGVEGSTPRLYPFIKNMFRIDVVNQGFGNLKQSLVFFVHLSALSQNEVSAFLFFPLTPET